MANGFEGKAVWITGASSGIGRALALELATRGADVAVSARRAERLTELVGAIEALGRRAVALPCDVTDEDAVREAADRAALTFGKLDVAVANAGWAIAKRIEDLTFEDWRRQLDTNVIGAAMTARHALPHLRETRGRLGLIASVTSMVPVPRNGAYAASKYAVRAIGQTLAMELHGTGVTCTTVHPGFVESEINQVDNDGVFHADREDKRPRKLMWSAERAAAAIATALHKRKREVVITGHGKLGGFVGRHAPGLIHFAMTRRS